MPRINLLDKSIYNRISAGEVVERPASVVKELVENSIDSGASEITIEVYNYGVAKIVITDNGCGIYYDDIKKAFLPHATSKISNVEDLDMIGTLGFRGEALASISAVSHTKMTTKTSDEECGYQIEVSAGDCSDIAPTTCNNGTTIEVSNLFYNTPARLKFLKNPRTEEAEITQTISKIVFANPDISFNYYLDDKLVIKSPSNNLEQCIYQVWGKDIYQGLLELDCENKNANIKVKGYICTPNITKPNRNHQVLMVNGRVITDSNLSYTILNAYQDLIMKRNFPVFVLDILVPFNDVDVNVHPTKAEVRFANPSEVCSTVYHAVKSRLADTDDNDSKIEAKKEIIAKNNAENNNVLYKKPLLYNTSSNSSYNFASKPILKEQSNSVLNVIKNANKVNYDKPYSNDLPFNSTMPKELNNVKLDTIKQEKNSVQLQFGEELKAELGIEKRIVGQFFNCYLAVESGDNIYFIDQHAAHERVLFERLVKEYTNAQLVLQPLMIPFIKTFNSIDYSSIISKIDELRAIGISVEEFGQNCLRVCEIPLLLSEINLDKFFDDLLLEENEYKKLTTVDIKKDKIARMACRAAVKAGTQLSDKFIDKLITEITDNNIPLYCPHGRPTLIKYSKKDFEKLFKRIV